MAGVASAAGWQQAPTAPARPSQAAPAQTLVVDGKIDWIERAAVAARRPGVVQHVEFSIGMEVHKGDEVAFLNAETAVLERQRAELNARNKTAVQKAMAERQLRAANMARARRLQKSGGSEIISIEEVQTKEAELNIADAAVKEEEAKLQLADKEWDLANQAVMEHIITAPFDGEILEVMKQPGEAVQSLDPVLQMARTDQVRFYGWVPLEAAYRLKKGMIVDVTPSVEGADLPVEKKRFRGKLVFLGPELSSGSSRGKSEVVVKADILNNTDKELRVGHQAQMTIYIDASQAPPAPEDMLPEKPKAKAPQLDLAAPGAPGATPVAVVPSLND
jgi:RND family efflux transporter MFP subunit